MNRKHTYNIGDLFGLKKIILLFDKRDKKQWHKMAEVECIQCGKRSVIRAHSLYHAKHQSCSCARRNCKLAGSDSRLYHTWANMKYRCETESSPSYFRYGARGISVCDEWQDFNNFAEWSLSNGYNDNLTIDRIDSNGDYCPANCQWITRSDNTSKSNKLCQHRKADGGTYYAYDPSGNFFEFENANQFAKEHNMKAERIRQCTYRPDTTYNGWKFWHE